MTASQTHGEHCAASEAGGSDGQERARFSGFSLKAKKTVTLDGGVVKPEVVVGEGEEPELIDAIDGGAVNSLRKKKEEEPVVIPLPAIRRNRPVVPAEGEGKELSELDKEAEAALIAEAEGGNENKENVSLNVPMLLANRPEGWDQLTDEAEKYKADMEWRPEAPDLEAYERVKVEDIGAGMLRGMGWAPGKPVGREGKFARVVEPVEFLKRPSGLGLGASMASAPEPKKQKKIRRQGESRDQKQEFFMTESGKSKRTLDEKLVKRRTTALEEGSIVTIEKGPHQDLFGKM